MRAWDYLSTRLVGPNASASQVTLILLPALIAGLLCAKAFEAEDVLDWMVAAAALLAVDIVGGCIACSLPPLQRLHASTYADPLKQAGFQLWHFGHVAVIAWFFSENPASAAALGLTLLFFGAIGSCMCTPSVIGGFRVVMLLAWSLYAYALPGTSELFLLFSMALAFKLFVAFPSFQHARALADTP